MVASTVDMMVGSLVVGKAGKSAESMVAEKAVLLVVVSVVQKVRDWVVSTVVQLGIV